MLNVKMKELQKNLSSLLIQSSSDQEFANPVNKKEIERELKSFTNLTHGLDQSNILLDADPAVKFLPNQLSSDTQEAYLAFREGNTKYSRSLLRTTANFCIACHSMSSAELQLNKDFFQIPKNLKPFELAQFFAVSRQFDGAIENDIKAINESSMDRADLEEAVYQGLAIAIRVKNKPSIALELVQAVISSTYTPVYLKMNAMEWKKSIQDWESKKKTPAETESAYFNQIKKLLDQASKVKKFPMDRSADILYLRASGMLHELIRVFPQSNQLSEAFYLQGICYDVLSSRKLESMSNIYFEACMRSAPHSATAENCYRRYEENIYFAYSGSTGNQLPEEIKSKLIELWTISILTKRLDEVRK